MASTVCATHLDEAGAADELLGVHHVHQGLLDGHLLDAGHVEAVHVLPPCEERRKRWTSA